MPITPERVAGSVPREFAQVNTPIPVPVRIRGILTGWTGFGQIAERLGRGLESLGHEVSYEDYGSDRRFLPERPFCHERTATKPVPPDGWVIHLACPHMPFDAGSRTLFFTMWETSDLIGDAVSYMNRADAVAVPCEYNRRHFLRQGVTKPVHVVPLGVDPEEGYAPVPIHDDGPTIFGMAARLNGGGGCRKGLNEGMAAFAEAFMPDADVLMKVKVWPDCLPHLNPPPDKRIVVETTPMTPGMMARWTQNLTCLFVPSRGEGWGLHTLQAMACGRPVIAAVHSGTAEFFDGSCGWELEYDLRPAGGFYEGCGTWAVPQHDSMVRALRAAHARRFACRSKGQSAARRAVEFTWGRTALMLSEIMNSHA